MEKKTDPGYQYFTEGTFDNYAFYRIPKKLVTGSGFRGLSNDARLLYGILLDRVSLSRQSGWVDKNGHVYIIFTIDELGQAMGCARQKAEKLLKELEKAGLLERKRRGLGKPNYLYVKDFAHAVENPDPLQVRECGNPSGLARPGPGYAGAENLPQDGKETVPKKYENHISRSMRIKLQEVRKSYSNNTDINNTDFSNTESIESNPQMGSDPMRFDEREGYRIWFQKRLYMDILKADHPGDERILDEILNLLVEAVTTKAETIRIGKQDLPTDTVKNVFLKLGKEHIEYFLQCLHKNTTEIRNIRQYILTSLYNAPMTIDAYYRTKVQHDFSHFDY